MVGINKILRHYQKELKRKWIFINLKCSEYRPAYSFFIWMDVCLVKKVTLVAFLLNGSLTWLAQLGSLDLASLLCTEFSLHVLPAGAVCELSWASRIKMKVFISDLAWLVLRSTRVFPFSSGTFFSGIGAICLILFCSRMNLTVPWDLPFSITFFWMIPKKVPDSLSHSPGQLFSKLSWQLSFWQLLFLSLSHSHPPSNSHSPPNKISLAAIYFPRQTQLNTQLTQQKSKLSETKAHEKLKALLSFFLRTTGKIVSHESVQSNITPLLFFVITQVLLLSGVVGLGLAWQRWSLWWSLQKCTGEVTLITLYAT